MISDDESVSSNRSSKTKSSLLAKIKKNRTNSVDSQRSIDPELEDVLLYGDGEKTTETIEHLSNLVEYAHSKEHEMDVSVSPSASQSNQITNGDQIFQILTEMKDKQSALMESQFTKKDGIALKKSVDIKFAAINTEIKAHSEKFSDIEERMSQFERSLAAANYDRELTKQQLLKNNISIFGCPKIGEENVTETALKVFKAFGSTLKQSDFSAVYRTSGKKPSFTSIVVKFKVFEVKLAAMSSKAQKQVKVSDVFGDSGSSVQIYLNHHVTPFFGKLLAAGRTAVKDELIHSCWINAMGCMIKLEENGKPMNVRSLDGFDSIRSKAGATSSGKRNKPDDKSSPPNRKPKKPRQQRNRKPE